MDPTITASVIGAAGFLLGALIQPLLADILKRRRLRAYGIPDISGQYNGLWYLGRDDDRSEYIRDVVDIKWTVTRAAFIENRRRCG